MEHLRHGSVTATRHVPSPQQALFCPVCHSPEQDRFFGLRDVPVCSNALWETPYEARFCPKDNITLTVCSTCGLITNAGFDPDLVAYNPQYENSLHFSPFFQRYADQLARRLVDDYALHGKTVIEIG